MQDFSESEIARFTRINSELFFLFNRGPGSSDKRPYITEAGLQALDEWYNMKRRELTILCPQIELPPRRLLTERKLCEDIINLLLGIPSVTFVHITVSRKIDIVSDLIYLTFYVYIKKLASPWQQSVPP